MAHIQVPAGLPGIVSLFATSPATARPMCELAETLLRAENSLTRGERELIASYVSNLNQCRFCTDSHSGVAKHALGGDLEQSARTVEAVKRDPNSAPISSKLKALLRIAGKVQADARQVSPDDVAAAREQGATDREVHDTVLIAAAFCMFNRYVDGLRAWTPEDPAIYDQMGNEINRGGYLRERPGVSL